MVRRRRVRQRFGTPSPHRPSLEPPGTRATVYLSVVASPVVITTVASSGLEARAALRAEHGVRLVEPAEEGLAIEQIPDGVYGFSYSPAIAAPLFATFRYRTYEMHRLANGEAVIIGFVPPTDASHLAASAGTVEITLHHDADQEATALVVIPCSRIVMHRLVSTPNQATLRLHVSPE